MRGRFDGIKADGSMEWVNGSAVDARALAAAITGARAVPLDTCEDAILRRLAELLDNDDDNGGVDPVSVRLF